MLNILKNKEFQWTSEVEKSLQQLKSKHVETSVLAPLDFSKPFQVECDVFNVGIGAALM